MKRRQFVITATGATMAGLSGCGLLGGEETDYLSEPDADVGATITMTDGNDFDPIRAEIEEGEAVEWANESGAERQLRSNGTLDNSASTDEWDDFSVDVEDGESAWFTFEESGVYTYHDNRQTRHTMCGAIAVGDASADDIGDLTCE